MSFLRNRRRYQWLIQWKAVSCWLSLRSENRKQQSTPQWKRQKARKSYALFSLLADMNLARYYIGAEISPAMKEMYEDEILRLDEKEGLSHVEEIAAKVRLEGIEMKSVVKIGRFALVCLDVVKQEKPSLIVTTRSQRAEWVKRVFGSPVNELIKKAGCPVLDV